PDERDLSGTASDNRVLDRIEVCDAAGQNCQPTTMAIDAATLTQSTFAFADSPATPLAIGGTTPCGPGTELMRSINVGQSLTVADLDVELSIAHPFRNDVVVHL